MRFLALILALALLGLAPVRAATPGDQIRVVLYFAKNTPPHEGKKVAPEKLSERLHEVFGFKYYQQVKSGDITLSKEWEQWVVPRNDFFIRVQPLPTKAGEPKLVDYEIYKDGFLIARGKYEPHPDIPLFINGPDFKQGRFIFVLEAR